MSIVMVYALYTYIHVSGQVSILHSRFCVGRFWYFDLSPVYTQRLTRIGIRIKLTRIHVNALTRIRIRIT